MTFDDAIDSLFSNIDKSLASLRATASRAKESTDEDFEAREMIDFDVRSIRVQLKRIRHAVELRLVTSPIRY